jgi:exonuclease VII large subunit
MLRDLQERRARRIQQELEDELEEAAEFEREMEAIRTENTISRRNSLVSSQFSESIESWSESSNNSQLDTDPLA